MNNTKEIKRKTQEIRQILGMKPNEDLARVTITPDMAKELLNYNITNRVLSNDVITKYARQMQEGRFEEQADDIGFYNGELTNGQHRLNACVKAGVPFKAKIDLMLKRNLYTDRGFTRNTHDNMKLNNVFENKVSDEYSKTVAAVVGAYIRMNNFNKTSDPYYHAKFIENYHKEMVELCECKVMTIRGDVKPFSKAEVSAAFLVAYLNGVSKDILMHIRNVLNDGQKIDEIDTLIIKYRQLLNGKFGNTTLKTSDMTSLYNGITYIIYRYANPKFDLKRKTVNTSKPMYTLK